MGIQNVNETAITAARMTQLDSLLIALHPLWLYFFAWLFVAMIILVLLWLLNVLAKCFDNVELNLSKPLNDEEQRGLTRNHEAARLMRLLFFRRFYFASKRDGTIALFCFGKEVQGAFKKPITVEQFANLNAAQAKTPFAERLAYGYRENEVYLEGDGQFDSKAFLLYTPRVHLKGTFGAILYDRFLRDDYEPYFRFLIYEILPLLDRDILQLDKYNRWDSVEGSIPKSWMYNYL